MLLDSWQDKAIGIALIILGCSFAYKAFTAVFMGKVRYWSGFLPFTIISPLFIHLPPSKRSLIREGQGMWVYLFMGPIFVVLSWLLIEGGADILGLPATETINLLINHGDRVRPPAITFDKIHYRYTFPLITRNATLLYEKLSKYEMPLADKDKLLPSHTP